MASKKKTEVDFNDDFDDPQLPHAHARSKEKGGKKKSKKTEVAVIEAEIVDEKPNKPPYNEVQIGEHTITKVTDAMVLSGRDVDALKRRTITSLAVNLPTEEIVATIKGWLTAEVESNSGRVYPNHQAQKVGVELYFKYVIESGIEMVNDDDVEEMSIEDIIAKSPNAVKDLKRIIAKAEKGEK